ncbi:MAG: ATPase domain-containing protein [Polyangiaceae bacterium]|jgi:circadian clock protein KaiC
MIDHDNDRSETILERVPTGVPGFDIILNGGFFRGGVYMILARPGAGKTILGNQICFRHAASGGRAIFVTLLTESHGRMLAQLRTLEFFDPTVLGKSVLYLAGYQALAEGGLNGLLSLIRRVVRDQKATFLVIDGLVTAGAVAESQIEMKKFIHELQVFVDLAACTTLLLTGADKKNGDEYAQRTMVDGLVTLYADAVGMDVIRSIEVEKFRGGSFPMGRHLIDISDTGVTIYPRTEALLGGKSWARPDAGVSPFGVDGFDDLLGGGLLPGSLTMLLGAPGTGKTLLGIHFLSGVRRTGAGIYLGFSETPEELVRKAQGTGLDLQPYLKKGLVHMLWHPPATGVVDDIVSKLLDAIKSRGATHLFIDGLDGLRSAMWFPEREQRFFDALFNELRTRGVTTVLSEETRDLFGAEIAVPSRLVGSLDNVVFLRHVELRAQLCRLVSVVKRREGPSSPSLREFAISERGITVSPTFETAEAILSGIARFRPAVRKDPSSTNRRGKKARRRK